MATHRSSVRLLALLAILGCAHAAAKPPASTASSAAAPSRASSSSGGGSTAPSALDRSEEITAAELASIPDPVPAAAEAHAAADSATAPTTAPDAGGQPQSSTPQNSAGAGAGTVGAAKVAPDVPGSASSGVLWRVQIFASPDLVQAGHVAREASAKLGESAVVEYEGSLYKVRLGAFGSEAEAQSLRDRAIAAGYPGAFRMRAPSLSANDAR